MNLEFCQKLGVGNMSLVRWFEGIRVASTSQPAPAVLPDYPPVLEDRGVAPSELDCLAPPGKIHWYADGLSPPDLCVSPPHVIAKNDNVRVVHDWPNP